MIQVATLKISQKRNVLLHHVYGEQTLIIFERKKNFVHIRIMEPPIDFYLNFQQSAPQSLHRFRCSKVDIWTKINNFFVVIHEILPQIFKVLVKVARAEMS